MDRVDDADRPVGTEHGPAILRAERRVIVAFDADRRAAARLVQRRQHVEQVGRLIRGSRSPAEVAAHRRVYDADGPIPRQTNVPFHVAVEAEEFAIGIEGGVELVAIAGGDESHVLAVVVEPPDRAAGSEDVGGVPVGVVEARQ